jgi:hypothetical protein
MQAKFDRAGEDAWRAGLSFDSKTMGVDGLSAFVDYARGNTPDAGDAASPDQEEFDFTVDYQLKNGLFDGLWLRVRASFLDQHGPTGRDTDEIRLILNYDLPVLSRSEFAQVYRPCSDTSCRPSRSQGISQRSLNTKRVKLFTKQGGSVYEKSNPFDNPNGPAGPVPGSYLGIRGKGQTQHRRHLG